MYDHEVVDLGQEFTIKLRIRNVSASSYLGGRLVLRANGYFSLSAASVPAIRADAQTEVYLKAGITGSKVYKDVPTELVFELDGRVIASYESRPGSSAISMGQERAAKSGSVGQVGTLLLFEG